MKDKRFVEQGLVPHGPNFVTFSRKHRVLITVNRLTALNKTKIPTEDSQAKLYLVNWAAVEINSSTAL